MMLGRGIGVADIVAADESWPMIEEAVFRLFDEIAGSHTPVGTPLAALGWADIESEYPVPAAELLFRAQGRSLAVTDCLDRAMLAELAGVVDAHIDAIVLPDIGASARLSSGNGHVRGVVIGPPRGRVAVPVAMPTGAIALSVVDSASLTWVDLDTFDSSMQLTEVTGPLPDDGVDASDAWRNALASAHRGLATELNALTTRMLEIATELATSRVQFGAPIGSFQALRHALAEAAAVLIGSCSVLDEAWVFGGSLLALAAKAAAGRAHRLVAATAMQTCGAIGLTAEHDLHRYVQRGFQIDALCGSYLELEALLSDRIFDAAPAQRGLPQLVHCR